MWSGAYVSRGGQDGYPVGVISSLECGSRGGDFWTNPWGSVDKIKNVKWEPPFRARARGKKCDFEMKQPKPVENLLQPVGVKTP